MSETDWLADGAQVSVTVMRDGAPPGTLDGETLTLRSAGAQRAAAAVEAPVTMAVETSPVAATTATTKPACHLVRRAPICWSPSALDPRLSRSIAQVTVRSR